MNPKPLNPKPLSLKPKAAETNTRGLRRREAQAVPISAAVPSKFFRAQRVPLKGCIGVPLKGPVKGYTGVPVKARLKGSIGDL